MRIDVYHTHIEVYPYTKGDCFELEKMLSKWVQINSKRGKYEPVGYLIQNRVLYLPKGINIQSLEATFQSIATLHKEPNKAEKMLERYSVMVPPRSEVQTESVDFLSSNNKFSSGASYCQYTLNLETAGGKTYCGIAAFTKLGLKTIVIVNREFLSTHWKKEIMHFTTIREDRIMMLDSDMMKKVMNGEADADVYIAMHQSLQSFARKHGWYELNELFKICGIGVKVYDEAHEFMSSIFKIDCFTNVKKTFYLTATLGRSDKKEHRILNTMLSASYKYDDKSETKVKRIQYFIIWYNGCIPMQYVIAMKNSKGFSPYKYIEAALGLDPANGLKSAFIYALGLALEHRGQILIVTPKKKSVIYIAELVRFVIGENRTIGTIFSDNSEEVNHQNQFCDIISSTIKSCGTSFNPPRLQTIICMEPHKSSIMTHQLKGRLDRFPGDEDTYFYDIFDMNIGEMKFMEIEHRRTMESFAKNITEITV